MTQGNDAATAHAWAAIGGRDGLAESVTYEGAGPVLAARLPVRELARATVGACSLAASELLALRRGVPLPAVRVREGAVATAFVSERHLRIDGRVPTAFAPLSGFWRTADGWVRTHANYPHHRARLLGALELRDAGDAPATARRLAAELATREAHEVQETVYAAGGLAVAVAPAPRSVGDSPDSSDASDAPNSPDTPGSPGAPGAGTPPLVELLPGGASGPAGTLEPAALPAEGIRVLDLTRVISGPVATRTLALLGADVLRVDSPRLPEQADAHTDTGPGKRSALLDLSAPADREVFEELLATADVVVSGYRPGALDPYGLAPEALFARRPGLIVAQLCAWGWSGPWSTRRGFDSLVQAASGIAAYEAKDGEGEDGEGEDDGTEGGGVPGALPAQALDHGTGYLIAGGILRALTERQHTGEGRLLRYSLAGTASWLLHGVRPAPVEGGPYEPAPWLTETPSAYGPLRHALSPVHYEGAPVTWRHPPTRWGTDLPKWA
ncbi:CoA transferase [Streptomyces sp. NPDC093085]|uniref:CoA transferase n=1 Tax=Streptomyces sp. NPDC093085 TaxID=3155068 RepID=UPI003438F7C5